MQVSPAPANMPAGRLESVDALRGLVMIVMALDHVRDFLSYEAMHFSPEDLTRTTVALFFTRWVTHFCAPVFAFAAGSAAFLWWSRGHSRQELSRFLLTRGLWLISLEFTVMRFALYLRLTEGPLVLTVMWSLGASLAVLAALIYLPLRVLAGLSIGFLALHNLADSVTAPMLGSLGWLWSVLMRTGGFAVGGAQVIIGYPLLPWLAIVIAGFCFGAVLVRDPEARRKWILRAGLAATTAFLLLRTINQYGDPRPWSVEANGMTLLSFLRCAKYPPSLAYVLMTLGPALLVLAWFDRLRFSPRNPLVVFGRAPLIYFLGHFLVAHAMAFPLSWLRYGRTRFLLQTLPSVGGAASAYPPDFGWSLPTIYFLWLLLVLAMYPFCLWFGDLKRRRGGWLRYL